MKQAMVALKDAWDNSGRSGIIYGFVTTRAQVLGE